MAQNIRMYTINKKLIHNIGNNATSPAKRYPGIWEDPSYENDEMEGTIDQNVENSDEDNTHWDNSIMDMLQVEYNDGFSSPISNTNSVNFKTKVYPIENMCAVCNKSFSCQKDLGQHAQQEHPNTKSFKCLYCPALFSKFKSITAHFNRSHTDPTYGRDHADSNKDRSSVHLEISDSKNYENKINQEAILSNKKGKNYSVENKCAVCEKKFSFQRDLIKHAQEDHPNEKVFKCLYCTTLFSKLKSVTTHYKRSHSQLMKNFNCDYCDMTFFTHFLLERHRRSHTELRPFLCTKCDKTYKYKRNLLVHMRTHSKKKYDSSTINTDKEHMDDYCENDEQNLKTGNEYLDMHDQSSENDEEGINVSEFTSDEGIFNNNLNQYPFKCNECQKAYKYKKNLQLHQKSHQKSSELIETITIDDDDDGDDNYVTTTNIQGDNLYNSTYFIIDELNTDTEHFSDLDEEVFGTANYSDDYTYEDFAPADNQNQGDVSQNECGICMKQFKCQQAVAKHVQRSHTDVEFFKCPYCDDNFYSLDALSQHITIKNHPQKRNVCEMCLKSFDRRSDLRRHIRIHTDERPYTCNVCYRKFKQTTHLKRHTEMNHNASTNILKFACHICSKRFMLKETLSRHIRAHVREPKHNCTMCEKTFKTRYDWQRHQETHSSRKYLICEFCLKSFQDLQTLNLHLDSHTGERKFLCTICGKAYREKSHLVNHRKIHI